MKGRWISYSQEELSFIEWRQAMSRRALHKAFVDQFGRTDVTADDIKALCTRKGWKTGRTGCFEKGMTPVNKGKACPPGKGGHHPNARKTQFKKGGRTGAAAPRQLLAAAPVDRTGVRTHALDGRDWQRQ